MIQFIIAESTLLPYGQIDTTIKNADGETSGLTNDRYVSHEEFEINDSGVKDGIDYHTLTYESRRVNLDAVTAPPGKLVTGVRFHVTNDGRLTVQIRATDFNYVSGKCATIVNRHFIVENIQFHFAVQRKTGELGAKCMAVGCG